MLSTPKHPSEIERQWHLNPIIWSLVAVLVALTIAVGATIHALGPGRPPAFMIFAVTFLAVLSVVMIVYFQVDYMTVGRRSAKKREEEVKSQIRKLADIKSSLSQTGESLSKLRAKD